MFFMKPKVEPKVDRVGAFSAIVHEAIRNVQAGADWPTKIKIADALENFARAVRREIATQRPIM